MRYIAYTHRGPYNRYIESSARTTREAAARELFENLPLRCKSVETSEASLYEGTWRTFGRNIQAVRRGSL